MECLRGQGPSRLRQGRVARACGSTHAAPMRHERHLLSDCVLTLSDPAPQCPGPLERGHGAEEHQSLCRLRL
eukprot:scaffold497_cov368-Prasinococcus_capsulatus_cf.AAC.13